MYKPVIAPKATGQIPFLLSLPGRRNQGIIISKSSFVYLEGVLCRYGLVGDWHLLWEARGGGGFNTDIKVGYIPQPCSVTVFC